MTSFPTPHTSAELLDSLVISTLNEMTADPAWLVNDRGEKIFSKLAARGRVFREINDGDEVEHLLTTGSSNSNTWKRYRGSREAAGNQSMGTSGTIDTQQNGIWGVARSTILDVAANFNIPQDLLKRPIQKQIDTVQGLLGRMMGEMYQEEEAYFVTGTSAEGGTPTFLAPHVTDADFGGGTDYSTPSMSLLGLMASGTNTNRDSVTSSQYGDLSAERFMGIAEDASSRWKPYVDAVNNDGAGKTAVATNGQTIYEYLEDYLIEVARYMGNESVTDWYLTKTMYKELHKYLRNKSRINDALIANLASTSEFLFDGTLIDWHPMLEADTAWDLTSETTAVSTHPIIGLNLNSLRLNLCYGGDVGFDGSWITPLTDFAAVPDDSFLFKRMHARQCLSLDGGRRSFVYSDRFKA